MPVLTTAMTDPDLQTTILHDLVGRIQNGDVAAGDELMRHISHRLERLVRRMLRRFPNVHRWEDTSDVLQNSLVRLLRALRKLRPDSVRAFYGLAAEQIRRELLDLARYHRHRHGANVPVISRPKSPEADREAVATPEDPEELDRWCRFHEAVARLPAEEREVVGLVLYHGWTKLQIAALFQVDERTVRRRWRAACVRLHDELGDEVPKF